MEGSVVSHDFKVIDRLYVQLERKHFYTSKIIFLEQYIVVK